MNHKVPPQIKGAESDAVSNIEFETVALAEKHFETVKKRFLDINSWELFAGKEKAEFSLRNSNGDVIVESPKVGDLVAIKIPLLPNQDPDHLDWAKVEVVEEDKSDISESVYIRLRPTSKPSDKDASVTHFLDSDSTSNFIIKREGKMISAQVHARNEVPNTEDKGISEKLRNKMVAFGAMMIGSTIQWKGLTNGLIKIEE